MLNGQHPNNKPSHQYMLGNDQLQQSFTERTWGSWWTTSWIWARNAPVAKAFNGILGCISKSVASKPNKMFPLASAQLFWNSFWGAVQSFEIPGTWKTMTFWSASSREPPGWLEGQDTWWKGRGWENWAGSAQIREHLGGYYCCLQPATGRSYRDGGSKHFSKVHDYRRRHNGYKLKHGEFWLETGKPISPWGGPTLKQIFVLGDIQNSTGHRATQYNLIYFEKEAGVADPQKSLKTYMIHDSIIMKKWWLLLEGNHKLDLLRNQEPFSSFLRKFSSNSY